MCRSGAEPVLHEHAHVLGGLACHDRKLQEEQQKAIAEWVTTLGKRLFTGNSLTATPAPIGIFEPRSYLQKLSDVWVYTDFLDRAAATASRLERLKLVIAWYIAGLRHNFDAWRKPFNPVLGETWQAQGARSGCRLFVEQISHHPPISAYCLEGRGYTLRGTAEPNVQVVVKHRGFKHCIKGPKTVTFADGAAVEFLEKPVCTMKCILGSSDVRGDIGGSALLQLSEAGRPLLAAHISFGAIPGSPPGVYARTDALNGYIAQIAVPCEPVDPVSAASDSASLRLESATGHSDTGAATTVSSSAAANAQSATWFRQRSRKGRDQLPPLHSVRSASSQLSDSSRPAGLLGSISHVSSWLRSSQGAAEEAMAPADASATFRGNWLSHLEFADGDCCERVWTLADCLADEFVNVAKAARLPSDSSFREDVMLLAHGDIKGAEACKLKLEEAQRRERRLRPPRGR